MHVHPQTPLCKHRHERRRPPTRALASPRAWRAFVPHSCKRRHGFRGCLRPHGCEHRHKCWGHWWPPHPSVAGVRGPTTTCVPPQPSWALWPHLCKYCPKGSVDSWPHTHNRSDHRKPGGRSWTHSCECRHVAGVHGPTCASVTTSVVGIGRPGHRNVATMITGSCDPTDVEPHGPSRPSNRFLCTFVHKTVLFPHSPHSRPPTSNCASKNTRLITRLHQGVVKQGFPTQMVDPRLKCGSWGGVPTLPD